jgi:outer membrane protein assembly factor BamB
MNFKCGAVMASFILGFVSIAFSQAIGSKLWEFQAETNIFSSPAIGSDGTIYFGSGDTNLYALNPNGSLKWKFKASNVISASPMISPDGTIYLGSGEAFTLGTFYALTLDGTKNGNLPRIPESVRPPPWERMAPFILGAMTTTCMPSTRMGQRSGLSRRAIRSTRRRPSVRMARSISARSIISLYALTPRGEKEWEFTTGGRIEVSPAIGSDGTIYFGSDVKKFYALNADGSKKWEFMTGSAVDSSPVVGMDGTIYFGSFDTKLYALNSDGTKKWEFTAGSLIFSSPIIGADGAIYFGSYDTKIYALNPDGTKRWDFSTGSGVLASPAISREGVLYAGSFDNKLYALQVSSGAATGPRPMFRHDINRTGSLSLSKPAPREHSESHQSVEIAATAGIMLLAEALETNGTIEKVEFYANSIKLGDSGVSPFTFIWTNVSVGDYSLVARVITRRGAAAASSPVAIRVEEPILLPRIIVQPLSQTVTLGSDVTFTVTANGSPPLGFQWLFADTNKISGATNSSVSVRNVQSVDQGDYTVLVSNSAGSSRSLAAGLTIRSAVSKPFKFEVETDPLLSCHRTDGTYILVAPTINLCSGSQWKERESETGNVVESSPAVGSDGAIYVILG